jgi:hypothetical protein
MRALSLGTMSSNHGIRAVTAGTPACDVHSKGCDVDRETVKMSTLEIGECFRSFLLLIGYDGKISLEERALLLSIGKKLDFDRTFCENAVDDLLANQYISKDPPRFSRKEIAESFLRDGSRIALSDGELHPTELEWLRLIAKRNDVSDEWLEGALNSARQGDAGTLMDGPLALEEHMG